MDELDKKIIDLLCQDARQSYREIARKLGTSHANIANRIENMEKSGTIKGYTVVLNPENFDLYPLCMQISVKPGANVSAIGQMLSGLDEVSIVSRVTGQQDLLVLALCKDKNQAVNLMSKVSGIEGIDKMESHVVIECMKLMPKWEVQAKGKV
jgi:Lrp/AsnC family leucine-responsive transcriptional regulator